MARGAVGGVVGESMTFANRDEWRVGSGTVYLGNRSVGYSCRA